MPYLVLQFRSGDMVAMHRLYESRQRAFSYLEHANDSSTSWWKVFEIPANLVQGQEYDIALRVRWESSNRVTFIGAYPERAPNNVQNHDDVFVERLVYEVVPYDNRMG